MYIARIGWLDGRAWVLFIPLLLIMMVAIQRAWIWIYEQATSKKAKKESKDTKPGILVGGIAKHCKGNASLLLRDFPSGAFH